MLAVEHGGKANTLNAALEAVSTPLIATIDADTLLMPYSLKHAVARLLVSPPDTVAVAGAVLVRNSRQNLLTRAQEWDYFLGIASVKRGPSAAPGDAHHPRGLQRLRHDRAEARRRLAEPDRRGHRADLADAAGGRPQRV